MSMLDTVLANFRDGAWGAVGALAGVLALLGMFVVYRWQRQRKAVAFGTYYSGSLLTVGEELAGRVKITLDNKPVSSIHVTELVFKNSGNAAILSSDFDRTVSIAFEPATIVLSADVSRQIPHNLTPQVSLVDQTIKIAPLMLNSGDAFAIKVLTTGRLSKPSMDLRIAGVSSVESIATTASLVTVIDPRKTWIATCTCFALGYGSLATGEWKAFVGFGLVGAFLLVSMVVEFYWERWRTRSRFVAFK